MVAEFSACWILHRVFDGERHLGADRQQNAQVVGGEGIGFSVVKRQHADGSRYAFQRNGECRTERAELGGIIQVSRFDRGIAVDDRLFIVSHPSRQTLADRNSERREQAEVVAVYMFWDQLFAALDIDCDGIIWNQTAQFYGKYRQRFRQAE